MPRRYFNWNLAIVILISLVVLVVTAFGLRRWQKANSAERGLDIGMQAYEQQEWEKAASNLGRYLSVEQEDVSVLFKYADAVLKIRPQKQPQIEQAIASYRIILRVEQDNLEAAKKLTEIYLMVGQPDEAELIARRQVEINNDPIIRRLLAFALIGQRQFDEAAEVLQTICAEHPDQILAFEAMGQLVEQQPENFTEPAIQWYEQAIKNNPSSALAYIARAHHYIENGEPAQAITDLNKAETLDLSDFSVHLRLARELVDIGLLDKAQQHLTALYEINPVNQTLWQIWAQSAIKSESQQTMQEIAELGLKELSSQPWDFMPLATELLIRADKLDDAADYIQQLRDKDVATSTISFLEGLICAQKEDFFQAIKYWRESIELGNNSTQIPLAIASALLNIGDTQSAIRTLRNFLNDNPDSFEGHLMLARALVQIRDWTDALEQAEKAVELEPENSEAILLKLQAVMQTTESGSDIASEQILQNMEKILSELENNDTDSLEVSLLRLQLEMQNGNFTDAQKLIDELKNNHPLEVRIFLAQAELLTAQGQENLAISTLNETIEKFPESIGPVRYLAALLFRQDEKAKCETAILDALNRLEDPAMLRELGLLLAQFYIRWEQIDNVYTLTSELAQKLPNDIPIKRQLLSCEQVITDTEQAKQIIDEIKSLEGENGWQWRYEQAKVWFFADDFKDYYPQMITLLQENLLVNSNDQTSRMLLARTYEKAGELQLAVSTYREALSRAPYNANILIPTIAALYKIKDYEQAEILLARVSQLNLNNPQIQQLQLQSFLRQGQFDSASQIMQDIVINDPENQDASLSLAFLLMQQGKFEESEKILIDLKADNPNSIPVMAAHIQLKLRQNKIQEALQICNNTVENLNNASAYILRARTYATLGNNNKAIEDLNQAVISEADNVEVWIARSDYYRSIGEENKSADDIQHALSLDPDNFVIQKRAISLFLGTDNSELIRSGTNLLEQALQVNPEDTDLQMYEAGYLFTKGSAPSIESSIKILENITHTQPETSQAWLMLGEIMLQQNEPGKAVDYASRGLAYTPNDRQLLFLKARGESARSPLLAVPTLRQLYQLDPNNVDTAIMLANTYIASDEPQKAVELLENQQDYSDSSNYRKCSIALAMALYKAGNKTDSQKQLDSLIESEPDDPAPLLAHVQLLINDKLWNDINQKALDWYQEHPGDQQTIINIARNLIAVDDPLANKTAENIIQTILRDNPDSTEAVSILAILLETTGRHTESLTQYKKLLELEPENPIAINNLAWIMSEEEGLHNDALELAQKGLKRTPDYIDLIDTRGVIYYRLGRFEEAVQDLINCVEMYPPATPQSAASRFHLARALVELGQNQQAIEYLNQAVDVNNSVGGLSNEDLTEAQNLLRNLNQSN